MTTIHEIKLAVSLRYGVSLLAIKSLVRTRYVLRARHIAQYLARELTTHSFPAIAREFNRDHSTIIHACGRIEQMMADNPAFAEEVRALRDEIEQQPAADARMLMEALL